VRSLRLGQVLLIALAAVVAIGLLQIIQTSQATTASFEIQRLEQQKLELGAEVGQLEADVARLSSITRIEAEAKRLGLVRPASVQALEVNVPPPDDTALDQLPSRFAPDDGQQSEAADQDSSWWRDLIGLLPFN
jgi:cell division protein FtsL